MDEYTDAAGRSWWYTFWSGATFRRAQLAGDPVAIRYGQEILTKQDGIPVDRIYRDCGPDDVLVWSIAAD